MRVLKGIGTLAVWLQILLYGIFIVALFGGIAWVAYRQSRIGFFVAIGLVACVGVYVLIDSALSTRRFRREQERLDAEYRSPPGTE